MHNKMMAIGQSQSVKLIAFRNSYIPATTPNEGKAISTATIYMHVNGMEDWKAKALEYPKQYLNISG